MIAVTPVVPPTTAFAMLKALAPFVVASVPLKVRVSPLAGAVLVLQLVVVAKALLVVPVHVRGAACAELQAYANTTTRVGTHAEGRSRMLNDFMLSSSQLKSHDGNSCRPLGHQLTAALFPKITASPASRVAEQLLTLETSDFATMWGRHKPRWFKYERCAGDSR